MPSIAGPPAVSGFVFDLLAGDGELPGAGVTALSAACLSPVPSSFPPEMAASSVIQISASGRRALRSSRISGQKLRSLITVMSGVATLSSEAACFLSLSSRVSATLMVSIFC